MGLSKLAEKCKKCPFVDACDRKEMEAVGYLGLDSTYGIMGGHSKGGSSIPNIVANPLILGIDISLHEVNPRTINNPINEIEFIKRITDNSAEEISRNKSRK